MLRGSVAHSALHKFYAGLPKELGFAFFVRLCVRH